MEPPKDAEPVKTDGGATTDLQPHPSPHNIYMNLSHNGRYIQYNFSGNIFEVTAKYNPLIMLGRGPLGIVCSGINSETNEKIVGIKDIVLPPQRDAFEDVYIAYELMDTDPEKLIKSNQELTKYHHQFYMYQLLRGLKYIHSANVLHRDLKPGNILLNVNSELKICDFGLAHVASDAMTQYVGTKWYRAPELLLSSSAYTSAIDVWSVGCILLEMMTRTPLFPGRDRSDQLRSILEFLGSPTEDDIGSLNESGKQCLEMLPWFDRQSFFVKFLDVPFLAVLLLEKMLKFDPRNRISVEDALADPYFKTMHNINNEPVCTNLFDFDLEEHPLTVEQIKELIYHEALAFNPGPLASNPEPATVENEQYIVLPPQRDAFEDVYIAYELMGTDLENIIKSNQELTKSHHQYFMYHFLRGLKYIHSANVLHGDLKPSSILLNANWQLKICDFGLARAASDAMTEYVGPRWYHAPELLLDTSANTSAIDIWSAGCIFLEMMTRTPLFSGRDSVDQLRLILELIGSPTEDDIGSLNESAKKYLRMIRWFDHQPFFVKFPDVPFLAVLLLEKMLKFDPRKRISVEDALAEPYFKTMHNINNEPVCTKPFDFDLEEHPRTVEQIKELIYHEALAFNPEPATVEKDQ
ncbi:hypothetical protein F2Q70_00041151 [Brassica cretica]|uniref:Protein kinase domain-containing protein n=1 Tax=Brassica cretica TaxID=69181 RepID=A0A8S9K9B5_BRACR|nr:hypothetical protein F2Q70_00041151 [Brassica cretica]